MIFMGDFNLNVFAFLLEINAIELLEIPFLEVFCYLDESMIKIYHTALNDYLNGFISL